MHSEQNSIPTQIGETAKAESPPKPKKSGKLPERTRLEELERKESAAASRLEELEMLIASMGGGTGAELLAVESQVAQKQLELSSLQARLTELEEEAARTKAAALLFMEEQRALVVSLEEQRRDISAQIEQEVNRLRYSDAEFIRQCLDDPFSDPRSADWESIRTNCQRVLNQLASRLCSPGAGDALKAVIPAIRQLDRLDAMGGTEIPQPVLVLRAQVTEALSSLGVFEFSVTPGTEIEPELERLIEPMPGIGGDIVLNTMRTGFLMEQDGALPMILRPAVVATGREEALLLVA